MNIPFTDLTAQYSTIAADVELDIINCLRNCQYVGGYYVERFERYLGNYLGANHIIGVSNITDAIMLIFESLSIYEGDYVLVPNNAYIDSVFAIRRTGAKPIFVDVDANTYLMDMEKAEELLEKQKQIKAILVVDLYGQQPNMERFEEIAKKHKVYLIEDASHSIGSTHRGRHVGYYSDMAIASFQPEHNLGTVGQGAVIITNDSIINKKIRTMINQDYDNQFFHVRGSFKLNSIVAAQLYHALYKLEDWNNRRRSIARIYNDNFNNEQRPTQQPCGKHVYYLYEFKCKSRMERDALEKSLLQNNIGCGFHSRAVSYISIDTPTAYQLCDLLISLPIHPFQTDDQTIEVVLMVQSVVG